MQRDAKVTELTWNNIDFVEGHQLQLTNNKDKSRTHAAIYMHENRLYIVEATVPAGYPEPGLFQQSLGWLDENGKGFRYRSLYHNGFPPLLRGSLVPAVETTTTRRHDVLFLKEDFGGVVFVVTVVVKRSGSTVTGARRNPS